MLLRHKRHLKKQTNLEITYRKSREIYKPTLPPPKRKQNQLPSKMLKIKPNQYLHVTFSTPSSPMSEASVGTVTRGLAQWRATGTENQALELATQEPGAETMKMHNNPER